MVYYAENRYSLSSPTANIMKAKKMQILIGSLMLLATGVHAIQVEGVDVPPQVTVSGKTLQLNGAGVRVFKFLMVPIKVYVASFYAPTPLRTAAAAMATQGPVKFNFAFLAAVDQAKVAEAWNAQFDASVSAPYPGLANDQAAFVAMFGPLKTGGVQSVEIEGNTTRVFDGGKLKGTITGRDFQQAFLSMWFGSTPVTPQLKAALLGS